MTSALRPITVTLTGTAPLLMKSLAIMNTNDPRVQEHKELVEAGKNRKVRTSVQEDRLRYLEFELAMYWDQDLGPYLPSWNIVRSIQEGAKAYKFGQKVLSGLFLDAPEGVPLQYTGPRDVAGLYNAGFLDERPVNSNPSSGKGGSMVVKVRPRFNQWQATFTATLFETVFDLDQFIASAEMAGRKGIGDYRDRFGKFSVEVTA